MSAKKTAERDPKKDGELSDEELKNIDAGRGGRHSPIHYRPVGGRHNPNDGGDLGQHDR